MNSIIHKLKHRNTSPKTNKLFRFNLSAKIPDGTSKTNVITALKEFNTITSVKLNPFPLRYIKNIVQINKD